MQIRKLISWWWWFLTHSKMTQRNYNFIIVVSVMTSPLALLCVSLSKCVWAQARNLTKRIKFFFTLHFVWNWGDSLAKLVREDYTQRDRARVQRHHSSTMRSNIAAKHSARSIKVRSTMSRDSFNPCKVRIYSMRSRPRHRRESATQWPQLSAHKWQMVAIMHFFNTFIVGSSQQWRTMKSLQITKSLANRWKKEK